MSKTSILDRYLEDERHRVHLQSEGVTKEKVKEWDRIANKPTTKHVPTEAERERWKSTYHLRQTTAGGGDTVATNTHPDSPKAQEWHREHFRRQESNTSTQPQTSNRTLAGLESLARLDLFVIVIKIWERKKELYQVHSLKSPMTQKSMGCSSAVVCFLSRHGVGWP